MQEDKEHERVADIVNEEPVAIFEFASDECAGNPEKEEEYEGDSSVCNISGKC